MKCFPFLFLLSTVACIPATPEPNHPTAPESNPDGFETGGRYAVVPAPDIDGTHTIGILDTRTGVLYQWIPEESEPFIQTPGGLPPPTFSMPVRGATLIEYDMSSKKVEGSYIESRRKKNTQ